jgi:hypothetical protein
MLVRYGLIQSFIHWLDGIPDQNIQYFMFGSVYSTGTRTRTRRYRLVWYYNMDITNPNSRYRLPWRDTCNPNMRITGARSM